MYPPVLLALIGLGTIVHLARGLLEPAVDSALVEMLAFIPVRFLGEVVLPFEPWTTLIAVVAHALLHSDVSHLAVNAVWLMVVGPPVARRMPGGSFLAYAALCGAGGAMMYLVLQPNAEAGVIGASGAISGLMAAAFRLIFAAEGSTGRRLLRAAPLAAPRLSVRDVLTRPLALLAVAAWLGINLAMAVTGQPVAWEAHLGGFLVGLLAFDLFDRGSAQEPRSTAARQ